MISVVKRVKNWRTLAKQLVRAYDKDDCEDRGISGATDLDALQHECGSDEDCLKTVVSKFLQTGGHYWLASWRAVIWSLYMANEIKLADQIQNYGELLKGMCLSMCTYTV